MERPIAHNPSPLLETMLVQSMGHSGRKCSCYSKVELCECMRMCVLVFCVWSLLETMLMQSMGRSGRMHFPIFYLFVRFRVRRAKHLWALYHFCGKCQML